MSRTRKTDPHRVKERRLDPWRMLRYPWAAGGAQEGVKEGRKHKERQARAQERDALKQGEEPEPYKTRSTAKWEAW